MTAMPFEPRVIASMLLGLIGAALTLPAAWRFVKHVNDGNAPVDRKAHENPESRFEIAADVAGLFAGVTLLLLALSMNRLFGVAVVLGLWPVLFVIMLLTTKTLKITFHVSKGPGADSFEEESKDPVKQVFKADSELDREIGWIKWTIRQAPEFEVIDQGEGRVLLRDVEIQVLGDEEQQLLKQIHLNPNFTFGISYRERDVMTGFGFMARNQECTSFSWEWFEVDGERHATKLQEAGELEFEVRKTGAGFEIVRTNFPSLISCRVTRMGIDKIQEPFWRVELAQGSHITWPSLVGGKVIPN